MVYPCIDLSTFDRAFQHFLFHHSHQGCESDEEHVTTLRLEDILVFVTGADLIPPMGFDRAPEIFFSHIPQLNLAVASTCSPSITLPTCHDSYKDFKDAMVESIVSGLGFGKV